MKLRPVYAVVLILLFAGAVLVADLALEGGFSKAAYQRVSPDADGRVVLDVSDLEVDHVRFYRFLNTGNQEVKFFVGRDRNREIQVAFDANQLCYKRGRGYRHEDEWMVCNKCDNSFRLTTVNAGGGDCRPVPVAHQVADGQLVLREPDILAGWRYFR